VVCLGFGQQEGGCEVGAEEEVAARVQDLGPLGVEREPPLEERRGFLANLDHGSMGFGRRTVESVRWHAYHLGVEF
jgi:hypothetical protein